MRILIDIPDSAYKVCYDLRNVGDTNCLADILVNAVGVGTPIPDNATNGEWIDQYNDGNWHCSKCGAIVEKDEQINHNWYFCYHCGTKMNAPYQKGGK